MITSKSVNERTKQHIKIIVRTFEAERIGIGLNRRDASGAARLITASYQLLSKELFDEPAQPPAQLRSESCSNSSFERS